MALSLRKIINYFKKEDKEYESSFDNPDIDYDLCALSIPKMEHDNVVKLTTFDHIVIRFIYLDKNEIRNSVETLLNLCYTYDITTVHTMGRHRSIYLSMNSYQAYYLLQNPMVKHKNNCFTNLIFDELTNYVDNCLNYQITTDDLVLNVHSTFRIKDIYKKVIDVEYGSLDIAGYSWIDKRFITTLSVKQQCLLNHIWLIVDDSVFNDIALRVSKISTYDFFQSHGRSAYIIKMNLSSFINIMNPDTTMITDITRNQILKVVHSDTIYYAHLLRLIDNSDFDENHKEEQFVESKGFSNSDEDDDEDPDNDFFNSKIDELYK